MTVELSTLSNETMFGSTTGESVSQSEEDTLSEDSKTLCALQDTFQLRSVCGTLIRLHHTFGRRIAFDLIHSRTATAPHPSPVAKHANDDHARSKIWHFERSPMKGESGSGEHSTANKVPLPTVKRVTAAHTHNEMLCGNGR